MAEREHERAIAPEFQAETTHEAAALLFEGYWRPELRPQIRSVLGEGRTN